MTGGRKQPPNSKSSPARKGAAAPSDPDNLSGEEQALWRHVASSIEPIAGKARVRDAGKRITEDEAPQAPRRHPARSGSPRDEPAATPGRQRSRATASPAPEARAIPPLAAFDPRKAKKLGGGRAGIDARLDLHGLRQDEALGRLRGFLRDCYARELRTVLVITGKGRETDDPSTPFYDTLDRLPRGVLRRNLPRWLDEPELRAIVVSYTTAAQRHGGDGAFYIQIRKHSRASITRSSLTK